nr:hypothetical protein [Tanacetum cinerariifolium]
MRGETKEHGYRKHMCCYWNSRQNRRHYMVTVTVNQNDFCRTAVVIAVSIAGIFPD